MTTHETSLAPFASPGYLGLLALLPLLAIAAALGSRRRRRDWERLGQPGRPRPEAAGRWLVAIACLVAALARPRWGADPDAVPPEGHDVVLAIDVSRSMAAEDAIPDRLGVATETARSLVRALGREPGERVGIVAFAGAAVPRCPLTENLGAALEVLDSLEPGSVEPGGSDLAAALEASLSLLDGDRPEPEGGRAVVVVSDGEFHDEGWRTVLARVNAQHIVVHGVAVGDPDRGHEIPVRRPGGRGESVPLRHRGEVVLTRRRDEVLRAVAAETGGAFLAVGLRAADLGDLYLEQIRPEATRRRTSPAPPGRVERFPLFLAASLALGVGASWPRLRRRATLLATLALALVAADRGIGEAGRRVREGVRAFGRGDYLAASESFDHAIALAPGDPLPRYNAAAALYRLGRFAEAEARYREAREHAPPELAMKIDYGLGNAAFARGAYREAVGHYERCVAAGVAVAWSDRLRADAARNRDEALRRIPPEPTEPADEPDAGRPRPGPDPSHPDRPAGAPSGTSGSPGSTPPGPTPTPPDAPPSEPEAAPAAGGGQGDAGRPADPAARLADAVDRIAEARQRRPPRGIPPQPDPDRKDW